MGSKKKQEKAKTPVPTSVDNKPNAKQLKL